LTKTQIFFYFTDSEKCLVVDAVALMGGNEYLIQQMIDRLIDTGFRYLIHSVKDTDRLRYVIHQMLDRLSEQASDTSAHLQGLQVLFTADDRQAYRHRLQVLHNSRG
jgi:predicted aspartyl protease